MKILALDSSGLTASAAIVEDSVTIAEYTINYKKTHSQTLLPMLDEIRRAIDLDLSTVDAVAVASGPGSFTGLRIGSATAKGLGLALGIPIIPVPTLDALAYNLYGCEKVICPLMDARRNQVYTALYTFEDGALLTLEQQCAVDITEIIAKINAIGRDAVFLGDGVLIHEAVLRGNLCVKFDFAPACCSRQRAACVASLGEKLYKLGKIQTAAQHAPEYLRLSQAERELKEKAANPSASAGGFNEILTNQYSIRKMRESDLEKVTALEAACFSMPWKYKDFEDALTNPDRVYMVAQTEDGQIIGGCMLTNLAGEGSISNVAVYESFRRQKIASSLLEKIMEYGKDKYKMNAFTLEVRSKNTPALRLYERAGFKSEGIRPNFYDKPKDDALILWKSDCE